MEHANFRDVALTQEQSKPIATAIDVTPNGQQVTEGAQEQPNGSEYRPFVEKSCRLTFFSALTTAASSAAAATGAAILHSAGYTAYNAAQSAAAGAVGAATAGTTAAVILACCTNLFNSTTDVERSELNTLGQFTLAALTATLSAVIGYGVVYAHHPDQSTMGADQFAAASTLGTAVLGFGVGALGVALRSMGCR